MRALKTLLIYLAAMPVFAEQHVTRDQLPPAVAATVDRETKGATVKGFATEREHGVKVWEVETVVAGHTRDLQIAADGTLLEIEEEVAFPVAERGGTGLSEQEGGKWKDHQSGIAEQPRTAGFV